MSTKLVKFSKETVNSIQREIDEAMKSIGKKYGLSGMRAGNIRFNDAQFSMSGIQVKILREDSEANVKRMERLSKLLGFNENILGKTLYSSKQELCKVIDIDTKKTKYNIITQVVSNPERIIRFSSLGIRFIGSPATNPR